MSYRTFRRSARNFREFAKARKVTEERGLTYSQAQVRCQEYNANLTAAQRRKGTKLEFEEE